MELRARRAEGTRAQNGFLLLLQEHAFEAGNILFPRAKGGESRDRRLNQHASLGQLLVRGLAQSEQQRERAENGLVIEFGDERASIGAAPNPENAELLQRPVRLTY